ncbi:MAG: response regulator transcription factor [Lachnospiraceae bacterium]|nr:response regulator transcription factor [Lachnospiraceae bacterium]
MKRTILIVEDDNYINNMIFDAMNLAGYECIQAFSGTEGILRVQNGGVDMVLLDLMLPGKPGEEVIKDIKKICDIPVIVVSAKDSVDSKIELLRLGADDYLTKPFDIKELEVRIEVRLRRHLEKMSLSDKNDNAPPALKNAETEKNRSNDPGASSIIYKEMELNPGGFYVKVNNNQLDLTKHEFRILELLIKNPGRAFSKQAIYDYAWDDIYLGEDKTINVHISNIRKKIKCFTETEYIDTVWGIGFKLAD